MWLKGFFQISLLLPVPNAVLSPTAILLTIVIFMGNTASHLVHSTVLYLGVLLTPKSSTGSLLYWLLVSMCIPIGWWYTEKMIFNFWRRLFSSFLEKRRLLQIFIKKIIVILHSREVAQKYTGRSHESFTQFPQWLYFIWFICVCLRHSAMSDSETPWTVAC